MRPLLLATVLAILTACAATPPARESDPVKAYQRELRARTQATWKNLATERVNELSVGVAKVSFDIAPDGRVSNVAITSNTGNPVLADVVVRTVRQTRFPRMSPAVIATLESGRMRAEFDFTTFKTR